MTDAPKPGPAVAVPHHLTCICRSCCEARAAEVRRRLEEVRREQRRIADLACVELAPTTFRPAKAKRAQPGTTVAIAKRYGRGSR